MKLIEINDAIFDHGRFHPKVVLTDAANSFALALETMRELWPEVRHLLYRWHVYEAIRQHVVKISNTTRRDKNSPPSIGLLKLSEMLSVHWTRLR